MTGLLRVPFPSQSGFPHPSSWTHEKSEPKPLRHPARRNQRLDRPKVADAVGRLVADDLRERDAVTQVVARRSHIS
jgi:hypothetical protein